MSSASSKYLVCIGVQMYKAGLKESIIKAEIKRLRILSDEEIEAAWLRWMGHSV